MQNQALADKSPTISFISQVLHSRLKRRINHLSKLAILIFAVSLSACGGGGGGAASTSPPTATSTPAPVTPPASPVALTGRLVGETRQNGFSTFAGQNPDYKATLDQLIAQMVTVTNGLSKVLFPVNIPVYFSGCGTVNAFYGGSGTVHAGLAQQVPSVDAAAAFGPDTPFPAIVYCHELTENSLLHYLLKEFPGGTPEDALKAIISSMVFNLTVLFHEIGHAILDQHRSRIVDFAAMQQELTFPIKDSCITKLPSCNTFNEDFGDWISGYAFALALNAQATSDPTAFQTLLGGFLISIGSWDTLLGAGGDAAHGYTSGRQANILCYVYGAVAEFRDLDTNTQNGQLANSMALAGIASPATSCQTTYAANKAAMTKHLSFALPN